MIRKAILFWAGVTLAFSQQYTISTFAGGAPPTTPASAGNTGIGVPRRVAVDKQGNVYFSASNSVFKLSTGGTVTLVAGNARAGDSGDGGPAVNAQLNSPQGVAVDSAGNICIADTLNNRVRMVTTDGVIHRFAGNGQFSGDGPGTFGDGGTATDARLHQPGGLTVDSSGVVYIADTGDNTVRKVTTDGLIALVAGDGFGAFAGDAGPATSAELNRPGDVTLDSSGNIYIADTANYRIRKVTTDGNIATIAGTGSIGSTGDGDVATKASLYAPMSIAVDSSGNIFILENGSSKIREVDNAKGNISTIAGNGTAGFGGDGSQATNAEMNFPSGMTLDSSGSIYVADTLNGRLRKISSSNITTIAGNGVLSYSGDNGPALAAQMNFPFGVAVDSGGVVYIADTANNVVRRVAKNGVITTFAGNGSAGFGGDGGAATSAQLNSPEGVAVDAAGNVYIADTQNARVRRVTGGTISTFAGNGSAGFGGDGSTATSAQLDTPVGLAVDAGGNVYIADLGNSRVRRVSGGTITTIAGNGIAGYSGDNGPAASATLNLPQGVAVDTAGAVYIADTGNNVVRRVSGGNISTIAGTGVAGFSGDGGQATAAMIGSPIGIAADSFGSIYITDSSARVRRITGGFITTIAGNGSRGYSGDAGAATSAMLSGPAALAVDSSGNVYVADSGNNAVRILQPAASGLAITGVVNGASNLSGQLAPGSVFVIYGSGLGPANLVQAPSGQNLPLSLAGTTVLIGTAAAPVLYTSATQVAAMVPFDLSQGNTQVSVGYQGPFSTSVNVSVIPVALGLFTLNSAGSGQVLAVDNNTGAIIDAGHPAKAGQFVQLYITGAGQTTPAGENGRIFSGTSPKLPNAGQATATIGGKTATVNYTGTQVGLVEGVLQVNVQIPDGLPAGNATITLQLGGQTTQSGVTIAVSGS